jgi:hypothetical protein
MRIFLANGKAAAIGSRNVKIGALIRIPSLIAIALVISLASSSSIAQKPKSSAVTPMTPSKGPTAFVDPKAATLVANAPLAPGASPAVRLANISTRLAVGSGDNVLIAGFIITGSDPKKVIVRGIGPTLPVNENLADPTLELHDSTSTLATNENWRDTQEDELKATTIPPANDYEASIVKTLKPGNYTAVLAGKGGTTGTGVVEVYDLDPAADSTLAEIATRGFVGQGDNVLIAGTIVVGSGATNVLFRALGPSLTPFGVPNALQDTTLEVHDGQGNTVATNDNWQDDPVQAAAIKATGIPPTDPREAAILRLLTPGAYTAIVRGNSNTTGVSVVEAYQIN